MKSQCDRLLAHLKGGASITAMSALEQLGIFRLAARVRDLRDEGHDIASERVTVRNRFGEDCSVSRYWLVSN